ncbi:ABC transporter transmembrane region family protein, partial [Vibrio parahaemolyticus V-223/04]
TKAKSLLVI